MDKLVFSQNEVVLGKEEQNLIFTFNDGSKLILEGFCDNFLDNAQPPVLRVDGAELPGMGDDNNSVSIEANGRSAVGVGDFWTLKRFIDETRTLRRRRDEVAMPSGKSEPAFVRDAPGREPLA